MKKIRNLFPEAIYFTLENEGIKSSDPYDPGGNTIYGIARFYHKLIYEEIKSLYDAGLIGKAVKRAKLFYKINYWNELYNYIKMPKLAIRIFDFGVNAGRKRAVKILQRTINKITGKKELKVDGIFGTKTLLKTNILIHYEKGLYKEYIKNLEKFYRSRSLFWRFGKGWLNRLKKRETLQKQYKAVA